MLFPQAALSSLGEAWEAHVAAAPPGGFHPPPMLDPRQLQRVAKFLGIGPRPKKEERPLRMGVLGASQVSEQGSLAQGAPQPGGAVQQEKRRVI